MSYLEAQNMAMRRTFRPPQHAILWGKWSQHERRPGLGVVVWSPFSRAAAGGKFRLLPCFALQESVCWSENLFSRAACILWASVQHERRQAWCCGLEPILESSGRRKVRLLPCLRFKKAFVGLKTYFREHDRADSFLSHVHVFLHCGGRGVLRSSFPLAWLAEELSRWNKT